MKRHAVIDQVNHKVVNVVVWDGDSQWGPPQGHYVIQDDIAGIDDSYDPVEKKFSRP